MTDVSTFELSVRLGNADMQTAHDIADVLRRSAEWIEEYAAIVDGETLSILDQNGNRVGEWRVSA